MPRVIQRQTVIQKANGSFSRWKCPGQGGRTVLTNTFPMRTPLTPSPIIMTPRTIAITRPADTMQLTMWLSDAGLRRRKTKILYPDHRPSPWFTEGDTPRSLEPIVRRLFASATQNATSAPIAPTRRKARQSFRVKRRAEMGSGGWFHSP